MSSPTQSSAWNQLQKLSEEFKREDFRLSDLYHTADDRFELFTLAHENLVLDYSKNLLTEKGIGKLIKLAEVCRVPAAIEAIFNGERS